MITQKGHLYMSNYSKIQIKVCRQGMMTEMNMKMEVIIGFRRLNKRKEDEQEEGVSLVVNEISKPMSMMIDNRFDELNYI